MTTQKTKTEIKLEKARKVAEKYIAKAKLEGRKLTDDELLGLSYEGMPTTEDLFFGKRELEDLQMVELNRRKVNRSSQAAWFNFQSKMLHKYGIIKLAVDMLNSDEILEMYDLLSVIKLGSAKRGLVSSLSKKCDKLKKQRNEAIFGRLAKTSSV